MVIETWVAHAQEVGVVRLPFNRVARQGMFPVLERQHILEDVDERAFARQSLLAIQQEIAESGIARFRQGACLAERGEGSVHQVRLRLHAFDPLEHSGRTVTSVIPLLMGHMALEIVIVHPLLMRGQQVFPGVRFLEAPIRHSSLDVYYVELAFPNFHLAGFLLLLAGS